MKLLVNMDGKPGELELEHHGDTCRFSYRHDGVDPVWREASILECEPGIYSVVLNGRSYEVKVVQGQDVFHVDLEGHRSTVEVQDPRKLIRRGRGGAGEGRQSVFAPMPGKVIRVLVAEGDSVDAGSGLVVVEAMKMQNEIKAPKAGRVVQLPARAGETVGTGEILAVIE
jgi:biotin carboxyl carrier protein